MTKTLILTALALVFSRVGQCQDRTTSDPKGKSLQSVLFSSVVQVRYDNPLQDNSGLTLFSRSADRKKEKQKKTLQYIGYVLIVPGAYLAFHEGETAGDFLLLAGVALVVAAEFL